MGGSGLSLQDNFLNQARREKFRVTIYLINGSKLEGKVKGFDNFTLILNHEGREHLIYKHAISTVISLPPRSIVNQYKKSYPGKQELEALAEKHNKK